MRLFNVPAREHGQNSEDDFGLLWKKPHLLGASALHSMSNFFSSILLRIYVSLFSADVLQFSCDVVGWFLYQSNTGLKEHIGKWPLSYFVEHFIAGPSFKYFSRILVEFSSEAI